MSVKNTDFLLGAGAILLSAAYLYFAADIQESLLSDSVGASGLPKILGWTMGGLGLLLCLRSVRPAKPSANATPEAETAGASLITALRPHLIALGLLAILISYILIAPYLGYAFSIGILIAAVAVYAGSGFNLKLVLISATAAAALWLMFVVLLGIPMPSGMLLERL